MSQTDPGSAGQTEQAQEERPVQGGSYERAADGGLKHVEGTQDAPQRAATLPQPPEQPAAPQQSLDASNGD